MQTSTTTFDFAGRPLKTSLVKVLDKFTITHSDGYVAHETVSKITGCDPFFYVCESCCVYNESDMQKAIPYSSPLGEAYSLATQKGCQFLRDFETNIGYGFNNPILAVFKPHTENNWFYVFTETSVFYIAKLPEPGAASGYFSDHDYYVKMMLGQHSWQQPD